MKAANLHELFPVHITEALQHSLSMFDQEVSISSLLTVVYLLSLQFFRELQIEHVLLHFQISVTWIYFQQCPSSRSRGISVFFLFPVHLYGAFNIVMGLKTSKI